LHFVTSRFSDDSGPLGVGQKQHNAQRRTPSQFVPSTNHAFAFTYQLNEAIAFCQP
jgi:hypothetical protein